jgi:chromosome segregation ATPase
MQLVYNNHLLGQIQSLEQSQLGHQRALQQRHAALRQALAAAEAARAEATKLRRDQQSAEAACTRIEDENRNLHVELGASQRAAEAAQEAAEAATSRAEAAEREVSDAKAAAAAAKRAASSATGDKEDALVAAEAKLKALSAERDRALGTVEELRSKAAPMVLQVQAAQKAAAEAQQATSSARAAKEAADSRLNATAERLRGLEAHTMEARGREAAFERAIAELQGKTQASSGEVDGLREQIEQQESTIDSLKGRLGEVAAERDEAVGAASELQRELESVGADLLGQARARTSDQEAFEGKVRSMQEAAREAEAAHREAQEGALAKLQAAQERGRSGRSEDEARYEKLQEDMSQMHDVRIMIECPLPTPPLEGWLWHAGHDETIPTQTQDVCAVQTGTCNAFNCNRSLCFHPACVSLHLFLIPHSAFRVFCAGASQNSPGPGVSGRPLRSRAREP